MLLTEEALEIALFLFIILHRAILYMIKKDTCGYDTMIMSKGEKQIMETTKITPYFYKWHNSETGDHFISYCDSLYELLYNVSHDICFSDCSDDVVDSIHAKGKRLHYLGWQRGMLYQYADHKGNIVYSRCFDEWDH